MDKNKTYRLRHRERIRSLQVAWRLANKHKTKAHSMVASAVKRGLIKRPKKCQQCETTSANLHAHHSDYSKPMDVLWLCASCHSKLHGMGGVCVGIEKTFAKGESHGRAKLNRTQVDEIRRASSAGESKRFLGRKYGVSESLIRLICNRKIWKDNQLPHVIERNKVK